MFTKGVINSAMIYSAQSPKHKKEEVSRQGEEQKCSLLYPNCFIRHPGGYMDLVMWHNLLQITEFYDKFKEDPVET